MALPMRSLSQCYRWSATCIAARPVRDSSEGARAAFASLWRANGMKRSPRGRSVLVMDAFAEMSAPEEPKSPAQVRKKGADIQQQFQERPFGVKSGHVRCGERRTMSAYGALRPAGKGEKRSSRQQAVASGRLRRRPGRGPCRDGRCRGRRRQRASSPSPVSVSPPPSLVSTVAAAEPIAECLGSGSSFPRLPEHGINNSIQTVT